jgi:phosphoglycolate phosphatase-like HAD superfamily hydrolase
VARVARRALLVDLDGTIWDSATWYPQAIAAMSGCRPDVPAAALLSGRSLVRVLAEHGVTDAGFRRLCLSPPVPLQVHDGVHEVLAALKRRGVGLGAVTNLPERLAVPMLSGAGLTNALSVVVGASRTRRNKPHPDPLLEALRQLGIEASWRSWYVGDMPDDQRSAAAAGLSFAWAGYATPMTAPDGADATLVSFYDIDALIR